MMTGTKVETPYFAKRSENGTINYWTQCGKSGQDAVDEGKRRADELVTCIRVMGHPILVPHVAEAIEIGGEWGLLERAFFHRLGEHLLP